MKIFKKILSLLLCFLMGITGPVISSALADGYGHTASSETGSSVGGNGGAPCVCCKNPYDQTSASSNRRAFFYNGSEYLQRTDLVLPGIMPIRFQRTYNNQATFDSPLGYGWDFSFNDRLRTYSDNSVVIRTTTGKKLHFIFTGGIYVCEESPHVTLENNPDGSFVFYSSPTDSRYQYDREGRLVQIQNIKGESLQMSYSTDPEPLIGTSPNSIDPNTPMVVSSNYQLLRIEQFDKTENSTGRYINFTYDGSSGRLTSVVDSTGRTIGYQHDALGNLTRIDYPENLFIAYEYTDPNDPHNMTNNLRGYGANAAVLQTARQYDTDDRMIREEYAGGVLEIDYTIPLQKTTVTRTIVDDQGTTLHEFDMVYEFNTQGYLIRTTDEQKSLELVRDNRNNVVEKRIYLNTGSADSPDLTLETSTAFTFDADNNLIGSLITLEDGEEIRATTSYDNGLVAEQLLYSSKAPDRIHQTLIDYNYDTDLPTTVANIKILKSNSPAPVYDSVSFQYNEDNQPTEILFGNGDTITMEYENGLLSRREDTRFTHDNRGNVIAIEDANGNTTHYEYDTIGRKTKIINSLGEEILFTFIGWDLTRIETGKTLGQPGRTTDFIYDDYGRIVQSSTDFSGSPILRKTFVYDSNDNLLSVTDQQGHTDTVAYDQWGRILTDTDANSNRNSYVYSKLGQLLSTTNTLNQVTTFEYDKLNRMVKTTSPANGVTEVVYNELNKVVKVTDPESREFTFGYDLAGQTIWQKTPVSDLVRYAYDGKGRISQLTLPDGTFNTYQYNGHNQLQEVTLAAGTSESSSLRYGYDKAGNLLWYSDSTMGVDPIYLMTYDALNRLETKTIVPINKTLQLAYNPQGQRDTLTVLDNSTELFHYSYAYDSAGRLTSLTEQQQSISRTTSFTIDTIGLLVGKTYPNGVTASLSYDNTGLLDDLHYQKSDSSTIEHFQYIHDVQGKITDLTDAQGTATFSYDALNHLTTAAYPAAALLSDEDFSYDQTGNRLTSSGITDWTYDKGGKLTSYNGHTLTYDTNGRQLMETFGAETVSYSYDNLNRLREAQKTGSQPSVSSFDYDFSNKRVRKEVDGISTWYLQDGANVLAEFDQSGQLTRNYSYLPGSFDLLGVTEGNEHNVVITNHLQTPEYVLNSNQSVLWQADYQPYGKAIINDDVDNDGTVFTLNQRFPGQYYDAETGLYYNWNRAYNPETGRYISHDPISINGGINLYAYTDASPLNHIDPTGLVCDKPNNDRTKRDQIIINGLENVLMFAGGVTLGMGMAAAGATIGPIAGAAGVFIAGASYIGVTISSLDVVNGLISDTEEHAVKVSERNNQAALLVNPLASVFVLSGDEEAAKEAKFVWDNKTVLISALVATQDYDLALDVLNVINEATKGVPKKDRQENITAAIKQAMERIPPKTSVEGRTFEGSRKRVGNWLLKRVKKRGSTQAPFQNAVSPNQFSPETVQ